MGSMFVVNDINVKMFRSMSDDDANIGGSVMLSGMKKMVMLCKICKKRVYVSTVVVGLKVLNL